MDFISSSLSKSDDFEKKSKNYRINYFSCLIHILNCKMFLFFGTCLFIFLTLSNKTCLNIFGRVAYIFNGGGGKNYDAKNYDTQPKMMSCNRWLKQDTTMLLRQHCCSFSTILLSVSQPAIRCNNAEQKSVNCNTTGTLTQYKSSVNG